jgi:D-xylose transport system substrate-binding protein
LESPGRNFQEPQWALFDKTAIQALLEEAGAEFIEADAQTNTEKQLSDIESLMTQGADALVIIAWDAAPLGPAIDAAAAEGIPVHDHHGQAAGRGHREGAGCAPLAG